MQNHGWVGKVVKLRNMSAGDLHEDVQMIISAICSLQITNDQHERVDAMPFMFLVQVNNCND